jgi:hypothetical protein
MTLKIARPGTATVTTLDEDSIDVPLAVLRDNLLTETFSLIAIWGAGTGVLGALETVVLAGAVLGSAGAGVLIVAAAIALFAKQQRRELPEMNKTIGVITSPAGLPVFIGMQVAGYSQKDSVRAGEYAKEIFDIYKLQNDLKGGLKSWKDEASAANDYRELRDFIHEKFEDARSEAGDDAASMDEPRERNIVKSIERDGVRIEWDDQGNVRFQGSNQQQAQNIDPRAVDSGPSSNDGEIERPGPGEVDGSDHDRDGDEHDGGHGEE